MKTKIETLFQEITSAFNEGRLVDAATHYDLPLAIYSGTHIEILETLDDVVAMLGRIKMTAAEHGSPMMQPEILGMQEIEGGRLPVQVEWTFYDDAGHSIARGLLTYFCRARGNSYLIEMMEYQRRAFPQALPAEQRPLRAV